MYLKGTVPVTFPLNSEFTPGTAFIFVPHQHLCFFLTSRKTRRKIRVTGKLLCFAGKWNSPVPFSTQKQLQILKSFHVPFWIKEKREGNAFDSFSVSSWLSANRKENAKTTECKNAEKMLKMTIKLCEAKTHGKSPKGHKNAECYEIKQCLNLPCSGHKWLLTKHSTQRHSRQTTDDRFRNHAQRRSDLAENCHQNQNDTSQLHHEPATNLWTKRSWPAGWLWSKASWGTLILDSCMAVLCGFRVYIPHSWSWLQQLSGKKLFHDTFPWTLQREKYNTCRIRSTFTNTNVFTWPDMHDWYVVADLCKDTWLDIAVLWSDNISVQRAFSATSFEGVHVFLPSASTVKDNEAIMVGTLNM